MQHPPDCQRSCSKVHVNEYDTSTTGDSFTHALCDLAETRVMFESPKTDVVGNFASAVGMLFDQPLVIGQHRGNFTHDRDVTEVDGPLRREGCT